MASKARKRNRGYAANDNYWQSAAYNQRTFTLYLNMLMALAMNRFRWEGLPDTCDARFLELQLHKNGIATICHAESTPDIWQSLIANAQGPFNAYGIPVKWSASGYNSTLYDVSPATGELVYYSNSRINPYNALELFARKMAHYNRIEDVNLSHQNTPWVFTAPPEKRMELVNLMKEALGGEPAVLGTPSYGEMVSNVTALNTGVPFLGEELSIGFRNTLNQALMYLGIPHLAFEKGERMIEDEARANTAPTNIMLLDCISSRRTACKRLREMAPSVFGDLNVYANEDLESYNFNYLGNIESLAQDSMISSSEGNENELA